MADFTSGTYHFRKAVRKGDFHRALGIPKSARKLDIDVAAARLIDRFPAIAYEVEAVAAILTKSEHRAVYNALLEARDRVDETLADWLRSGHADPIPDRRQAIWAKCCELLRFSHDRRDLLVRPKGAKSLARRMVPWIVESLLEKHLPVLSCSQAETDTGSVTRDLWQAVCPSCQRTREMFCRRVLGKRSSPLTSDENGAYPVGKFDPDEYDCLVLPCPDCMRHCTVPSKFDDTYVFEFEPGSRRGTPVRGRGRRRGRVVCAVLNASDGASMPADLLDEFYKLQQDGKDVTLDEVEADRRRWVRSGGKEPRQQPVASSVGNASAGAGYWIPFVLLFVLIRGGCEVAQHVYRQSSERKEPFRHDWTSSGPRFLDDFSKRFQADLRTKYSRPPIEAVDVPLPQCTSNEVKQPVYEVKAFEDETGEFRKADQ